MRTFWDVSDAQARELMTAFVRVLNQNPSKIRALADTRRAALLGLRRIRHPFNWAAFSIQMGRI